MRNPICLALCLAGASAGALADATIYGTFNAALESVSATGATAGSASDVRQTQRVTSNTSKIGFKGQEDLGNGVKALWQVEQEVSIDDGGARKGAWAGRNSFVGLEGGFGKVLLGNHDSAYKMFGYLVPLEDGSADFTGKDGLINRVSRLKNSVQYRSPELAGWLLGASYAADEARALTNTGQRSNGQVWSLAARYRQDALQTGVAFQRNGEQLSGNSLLANHQDFWKASLRYTLGSTELGVGVEHERMDMARGRDQRQTAWMAAATQRLGAWTGTAEVLMVDGKSRLSAVRNELPTAGYGLLNLRASYEWKQVRLDFGIDNLFDRFYNHPQGGAYLGQGRTMAATAVPWGVSVPGMGRSVSAGVTVKF